MPLAFLPTFCPLRQRAADLTLTEKGLEHWRIRRCATATELDAAWPEARRKDDFWVSKKVLRFLADRPQGIETEAIILEDSRDFSRVLLTAQTFTFSAAGQVSDAAKGTTSTYDFRRRLLAPFSFKVLCLGQFLTSGPFSADGLGQLSAPVAARLLPAVADLLMQRCRGYAGVLIKDLYPREHPATSALENNGFHPMPVDPVMTLDIPADWRNMDDYLAALTSKYRVRYRRARGKLEGITRCRLTADEVDRKRENIYALYQQVSSGADFNAASVRAGYFPWLARVRKPVPTLETMLTGNGYGGGVAGATEWSNNTPVFTGYFNEAEELIGFTTAIPNGEVLHAHYLGMEDAYKFSHHLYHNMLFDLAETAIDGNFASLDYGRTALEIKSSVGAVARDHAVLARARYGWLNRLIPLFTPAVYKAPEWVARNPFRV